jgi:hypothetical protein
VVVVSQSSQIKSGKKFHFLAVIVRKEATNYSSAAQPGCPQLHASSTEPPAVSQ